MNRVINDGGLYGSACVAVARLAAGVSCLWNKRGLGTAFKLTSKIFKNLPTCRAEVAPGAWMQLPIFEPYWAPVAIGGRSYEPEIHRVLDRIVGQLRERDWALLDGGANFGYWSAIAASLGCRKIAAVELNPRTYDFLAQTSNLNGGFVTINAALSEQCGTTVFVEDAGRHAVSRVGVAGLPVSTMSIDEIVASLGWHSVDALVIKLDVEGSEGPALAGAAAVRARIPNHVVIYEDHGADDGCQNTRLLLRAGYSVRFMGTHGTLQQIVKWEDALAVKKNPRAGYNFVGSVPGTELDVALS